MTTLAYFLGLLAAFLATAETALEGPQCPSTAELQSDFSLVQRSSARRGGERHGGSLNASSAVDEGRVKVLQQHIRAWVQRHLFSEARQDSLRTDVAEALLVMAAFLSAGGILVCLYGRWRLPHLVSTASADERKVRMRSLCAYCFQSYVATATNTGFFKAYPFFLMALGADSFMLSCVVTAGFAGSMVGNLLLTKISNRIRARAPVVWSCDAATALCYFVCPVFTSQIPFLVFHGVRSGCAGQSPVVAAALAESVPLRNQPDVFAMQNFFANAGSLAGVLLAAVLATYSFQATCVFLGACQSVSWLVGFTFLCDVDYQAVSEHRMPGKTERSFASDLADSTVVFFLAMSVIKDAAADMVGGIDAIFYTQEFGFSQQQYAEQSSIQSFILILAAASSPVLMRQLGIVNACIVCALLSSICLDALLVAQNWATATTRSVGSSFFGDVLGVAFLTIISQYSKTPEQRARIVALCHAASKSVDLIGGPLGGALYKVNPFIPHSLYSVSFALLAGFWAFVPIAPGSHAATEKFESVKDAAQEDDEDRPKKDAAFSTLPAVSEQVKLLAKAGSALGVGLVATLFAMASAKLK